MMDFRIPFASCLTAHRSKTEALYQALREAITGGALPWGLRLPSSRELAGLYELSRGTVNTVYDMLAAEGFVEARTGSGTFVAFHCGGGTAEARGSLPEPRLSGWGQRLRELPDVNADEEAASGWSGREAVNQQASGRMGQSSPAPIRFALDGTDLQRFPFEEWRSCLYAAVREDVDRRKFESAGNAELRKGIAAYLRRTRGIQAAANDIVITSGSMQAIALLAQLVIQPGDLVMLERPCYRGIRRAVYACGGVGKAAAMDERGIVPADWEANLLFVTPSRQFPTGVVLPLERRRRLLEWAENRNALIVEDDYDSEFRHHGRPIEPLKALDRDGRVVYIGTFSKTMPDNVRIGYAVLPPALRVPFIRAKQLFEPHPTAVLEQRALASFLAEGRYERHLRRMKRLYAARFDGLKAQFAGRLDRWFEIPPTDAGLHLFARWKGSVSEWAAFQSACRTAGVFWTDTAPHYEHDPEPSAIFGFSQLAEDELAEGIERLVRAAATLW